MLLGEVRPYLCTVVNMTNFFTVLASDEDDGPLIELVRPHSSQPELSSAEKMMLDQSNADNPKGNVIPYVCIRQQIVQVILALGTAYGK